MRDRRGDLRAPGAGTDVDSSGDGESRLRSDGKGKTYAPHGAEIARVLKQYLSRDELRALHRASPRRHFLVLARHLFLTGLTAWGLWVIPQWWLWIPLALIQGFNILGFIILLHEQVHDAIFDRPHPKWMRFLGLLYAFPSSISATQFARWHLDHHYNLGSSTEDPKRAHLSPKKNVRWYKALYLTPALFVIYSRASAREAGGYPPALRRTIAREKAVFITLHLALLAAIWMAAGAGTALRVYLVPLFLAFPIAFSVNRLGQHYAIKPEDPFQWSTLVNPHPVWDFIFLWSNFHLEHHYYPRVPFYRLKELNQKLQPLYRDRQIRPRTYGEILRLWFLENRAPHTDWFEGPPEAALPRQR